MSEHGHPNIPPTAARGNVGGKVGAAVVGFLLLAAVLGLALTMQLLMPSTRGPAALESTQLFEFTRVFPVHLVFTPEQWAAMEPKGGFGPFSSNPAGPPGPPGEATNPGDRGGPGFQGRPGSGRFGPSMFLVPLFMRGDSDGDAQLSSNEFSGLEQSWFLAWDTNNSGAVDLDKVRAGLNEAMPGPGGFGPGGGPPGSPAGAGGPGFGGVGAGPGGPGGGPGNMLLGAEGKRNGLASSMGIEFPTVQADLEFAGAPFPAVSVRYKGNGTFMSSRNTLKRSMKLDLNDHAPGRNIGGATKLNLHTCVTDPSWMNEVLSHKLFRDAGVPAPRTAYARVEVSVPGKYQHQCLGLYSIVENVDNSLAQDRFGTKKGALFKPVTRQLFEDLGDDWTAYRQIYDPKTPVSDEETGRVIAFSKLVSHASDAEFAARLGGFLDLDAFARFMAVTTWLSTMDSILGVGQNFYVYLHPKTGQFQFIPWDLDHSFGQFGMVGTQEQRENLSIRKPWDGSILLLDRVFKVEAFKRRYLDTMTEFQRTIFQPERIHSQVDQLHSILRPAIQEESESLVTRFDRVASGQPPEPSASPGFGAPGGFGQTIQPIKPFVTARAKSVADQLAGKSDGMQATRGRLFGGPGGPGGGGPRGPGGPGGFGGFGPGTFLGPALFSALDTNKSGDATRAELQQTLQAWFRGWDTDGQPGLTEAELRAGIDQDLASTRGGMPGFGPPQGGFGPPP
jgi:hypothetical protein